MIAFSSAHWVARGAVPSASMAALDPRDEHILQWDDQTLGIEWLDTGVVVISEADSWARRLHLLEPVD
jgi:hypothetical protein